MENKKVKILSNLIYKYRTVELAYIFGSSIKDADREPCDIDIGILVKETLSARNKLDLCLDIADKAESIFGRRADVVILNNASPFLKYQVAKFGKLIFERKENIDNEFRFILMTDYFDAVQLHHFFYSGLKGKQHG